jgi:hypothetical protein
MQKDLPVWLSEMNITSLPPTSNANIAIFDKVLKKYQTKWTGSGMVLGEMSSLTLTHSSCCFVI